MNNFSSDLGEIRIHKILIAQIAETSAMRVDGVAGLAVTPDRLLSQFLRRFHITGISIDLSKTVRIEIPILVKYGYNIPDVSARVQEEIASALSKSLNIDTVYVIVKVKGLSDDTGGTAVQSI